MQNYTDAEIIKLLRYPHLLGHLAGKDKLKPIHSEWANYIWEGKEHRSLQAFRGGYKSTILTELMPLVHLAKYPNARIAIVKKTYTSAAESVRNLANIALMPDISAFLEDFWGKWKFVNLKDGKFLVSAKQTKTKEMSVEALGLDSSFTGRHYDVVLFDDVIDLDDRLSDAEREHTKIVVSEFMSNIVDPGGFVGCVGTPWSRTDSWTIMPPARKYPVTKDENGEWSSFNILTSEAIEEKRKYTTPVLWAVNYELRFESEGDMLFLNPHMGTWHGNDIIRVKAHLDAAFDGSHFCAMTIMSQMRNGKLNAVGWVYPGNVREWIPFVIRKLIQYNCDTIHIETNPDKGYLSDILQKDEEVVRNHIWVQPYDERMNKHAKISTYLYEAWKNIEWAEETDKNYLEQITDYMEKQEPDDACFVAGTKIATIHGDVPIEEIQVGEMVITPDGINRVSVCGCTGEREVIVNMGLEGTSSHKIFNKDVSGFSTLDSLTRFNSCDTLSLGGLLRWQIRNAFFSMASGTSKLAREDIISAYSLTQGERERVSFIRLFGSFITKERYLKGITFIIRILIKTTMIFLIWSCWKLRNIFLCMARKITKTLTALKGCMPIWMQLDPRPQNGIIVQKGWNGIGSTLKNLWASLGRRGTNANVSSAENPLCPLVRMECTVQTNVGTDVVEDSVFDFLKNVLFVERTSLPKERIWRSIVQTGAGESSKRSVSKKAFVYNLTVEGAGMYYANGVLVSNCDSAASLIREAKFSVAKHWDSNIWKF